MGNGLQHWVKDLSGWEWSGVNAGWFQLLVGHWWVGAGDPWPGWMILVVEEAALCGGES